MIGSIWSLQSLQSIDFASGAAVEAAAELLLASSSSPDEVQPARTAGSRSREPRTARGVRRCGYTVIHPRTATCGWQPQPSAAGLSRPYGQGEMAWGSGVGRALSPDVASPGGVSPP